MRVALILALIAGVAVAFQANFLGAAQKTLGPVMTAGISGVAAGTTGITAAFLFARPDAGDLGAKAVGFAAASGLIGAFVVASIAFGAGHGGVARTLALVIASQLLVGLLLDTIGVFGAEPDFNALKAVGVALIVVGGVLVVRS